MPRNRLLAIAATLVAASMAPTPLTAQQQPEKTVQMEVLGSERQPIGQATFSEGADGVLIRIEVQGLPEGWHGVHLHKLGSCDDPGYKGSGSHVNQNAQAHGLLNEQGPDDGDLPNIHADDGGVAQAEFYNTRVTLGGDDTGKSNLLDADGTALVIHANPDDQISQPIGEAGERIACGSWGGNDIP